MWLPSHDALSQTMPDMMHTVKDVVENLFALIVSRKDDSKIRLTERKLCRFHPSPSGSIPYVLTKSQQKTADERLCSILTPLHSDFKAKPMFLVKRHLKSHDWKQVHAYLYICALNYMYTTQVKTQKKEMPNCEVFSSVLVCHTHTHTHTHTQTHAWARANHCLYFPFLQITA